MSPAESPPPTVPVELEALDRWRLELGLILSDYGTSIPVALVARLNDIRAEIEAVVSAHER